MDVLYTSEAVACRIDLTFSLCVYSILAVLLNVLQEHCEMPGKKKPPLC